MDVSQFPHNEVPEDLYNAVRDAILALARWMYEQGLPEGEVEDWVSDIGGDTRDEALATARRERT